MTDYVEGDVNQLDDDDEFDDDIGNVGPEADEVVEAPVSTAVLTHIAEALADEPDQVSVLTEARGRRVTLRLNVAQKDMGRVIGRRGRTAQAIRALVAAAGAKEGVSTSVDIVD
ncbi:MAG TPA: KH domain-containing protein [Acidimicrobiales bacterium]|nr:KH domain-containing protein [Acidimicrobiales bacterium]